VQQTLYACEHALKTAYEPEVLLLSGAPSTQLGTLATALKGRGSANPCVADHDGALYPRPDTLPA
jgi:hypothetical protein